MTLWYHRELLISTWKSQPDFFKFCRCCLEKLKNLRSPSSLNNFLDILYILGAYPACLKVLSHNFGAVLLKKSQKNVLDSVPLRPFHLCQLQEKWSIFRY